MSQTQEIKEANHCLHSNLHQAEFCPHMGVFKNGIENANVVFIIEYSKGKTERITLHLILQENKTLH